MAQRDRIVPLRGGLDIVTPAMLVNPGFAIAATNYESEARGYRRVTGYERFDGKASPSTAEYHVLSFDAGSAAILAGQTITGGTSGATAIMLVTAILESGIYDGSAAGSLVIYDKVGEFIDNETITVGGATRGATNGTAQLNGAADDFLNTAYLENVRTIRRALIAAVPGSGPVRGVATFKGDRYAWRDNFAGTNGAMWKATPAGWVQQTFGRILLFDAGTAAFIEGQTLTGGTSGATGTISRVVRNDGAWSSDAVGYIVLSGVSGTFQNNELVTSATGSASANGADVNIGFPPGGRYRSVEENFYATEGFTRLYFVNGVGRAHEWDGSVLAPIRTQASAVLDRPTHVAHHRLHLFLGFRGGSLQHSSTGEPLTFDAVTGAGEIGFGQDITGLKSNTRDSLIVTGRNKLGYLVGSSLADFDLRSVSESSGAIENTLEIVGSPIFLDDQGVRDMTAAESYGDWTIGTMTQLIEPLIRAKREEGILPVGAFRVRAKDQYRLFFEDRSGIVIYFGRKNPECMQLQLLFDATCFTSGENERGDEIILAGGADGFVYQIDRGTSFDGAAIPAFLRTSFLNQGAPNMDKRYHRARLEGQAGSRNTDLAMVADFSYGGEHVSPSLEQQTSFTIFGGGGFWDEALWNFFQWSASLEGQAFASLDGIGENVSIVFMSDSATEEPHSLSTITINFTPRRKLR